MRHWQQVVAATVAAAAITAAASCDTPRSRAYPTLPSIAADPRFAAAVDSARAHGLRVWIESDLVARWRAGRSHFDRAIEQISALARRPGVVGVKIADELGDHDGLTKNEVMAFLHDARAALRQNAPGKLVLIDIIGYELGCAPGLPQVQSASKGCVAVEQAAHQAVDLNTINAIMRSGDVDVVDLTTNMQDPGVYQGWGITRAQAQQAAFAEARRRGWDRDVRLQSRKALAFPTTQVPDAQTAAALVPDFVDVPFSAGVRGVDVWTYSQLYQGRQVHLIDPGLAPNPLWSALQQRKRAGDTLFTHYSPSFPYGPGIDADMQAISTAFTDVFCAAGTG